MKSAIYILITAIALFLWGYVSWMVLPWHQNSLTFRDEAAVGAVLQQSAPQAGVYMLPGSQGGSADSESDMARLAAGPYLYGMVRSGPKEQNMGLLMGGSFAIQLLTATFLYFILRKAGVDTIRKAILLSLAVFVFTWIVEWLPSVNWFEFPLAFTLPYLGDVLVSALLAGTILGRSLWR